MGVRTFPTPEELQSYRFPKNTGPNPLKNHKAIPAKIHTQVRKEAIDDDDDDDDDDWTIIGPPTKRFAGRLMMVRFLVIQYILRFQRNA